MANLERRSLRWNTLDCAPRLVGAPSSELSHRSGRRNILFVCSERMKFALAVQLQPDSWSAIVRRLEDGFFVGDIDVRMPSDFSIRLVRDLPSTTQFFRVQVNLISRACAPR